MTGDLAASGEYTIAEAIAGSDAALRQRGGVVSIRIQSEVWEHSKQKGGALLVLLALSDNADNKSHLAWPSVRDLARRSRMGRRQVQNILRKLEEDNEIRTVEPGGFADGRSLATTYRVFHPDDRTPQGGAIIAPGGRNLQQGGGAISDKRGAKSSAPQPSRENHKKEPSFKKSKEKEAEEVERRREGFEWWFGD